MNRKATQALDRETTYEALRTLLLSGEVAPGEALSERALSERFGVSRTPVREAIRTLANDGLLDIVPMRGTFVKQLSMSDLREIHEARLALEGMAAWLAAQRGVTPALQECAERLRAMAAPQAQINVDAAQQIGWQFHEAMFGAANNARLLDMYRGLRVQNGLALQRIPHYDAKRTREAIREHLAIFDAIVAGRPDDAQRTVWEHLNHALQVRLKTLVPLSPA
jgi:DNA-binding GntR family transcriptional regulator